MTPEVRSVVRELHMVGVTVAVLGVIAGVVAMAGGLLQFLAAMDINSTAPTLPAIGLFTAGLGGFVGAFVDGERLTRPSYDDRAARAQPPQLSSCSAASSATSGPQTLALRSSTIV